MAPGRSKTPPVVLQPRDFELFTGLGTAGTLDTNVLWRRYFPNDKTGQSCRRRMNRFDKHGLVQRTFIEVSSAHGNGRAPILYNLTPLGAKAVEDRHGVVGLRTAQGDRLSPATLRHRAGIGEVVLAISDGCRDAGMAMPDWVLEYDTYADVPKNATFSRRFRLCQEFKDSKGSRVTCWPDAGCQLTFADGDDSKLVLLLEYDRSTEDHPQLRDKLPPYERFFAERRYRQLWPEAQEAFLFFVFQTKTRLCNAAKSFADKKLAPRIRMAVASELNDQSPITDPVWLTVSLERRALLSHGSSPVNKPSSS